MNKLFQFAFAVFFFTSGLQAQTTSDTNSKKMDKPSFYDFTVKDIQGNDFKFSTLKGKKVIIVNTASECGLTPQYAELQKIYDIYKDKGLVIVGFPSNDFGKQEPGTNSEIAQFCSQNYGVTFPMMEKISVTGDDMHPLYTFLTKNNGTVNAPVEWNFQKFLIDENGKVVRSIPPKESVFSGEVGVWLDGK